MGPASLRIGRVGDALAQARRPFVSIALRCTAPHWKSSCDGLTESEGSSPSEILGNSLQQVDLLSRLSVPTSSAHEARQSRRAGLVTKIVSRLAHRAALAAALLISFPLRVSVEAQVVAPQGNPLTCAGYPEARTFQDVQTWFPDGQAHVHLGGCFPHGQQVTGVLRLDLRLMMHQLPGTLRRVKASTGGVVVEAPLNVTCPNVLCEFWQTLFLDTSRTTMDGPTLLKLNARVINPGGTQWHVVETEQLIVLNNGKPPNEKQGQNTIGSQSWLPIVDDGTGPHGYNSVRFYFRDPSPGGWPSAPLTSVWRPRVSLASTVVHGQVHGVAAIDPNIHAGDPGQIIAVWTGREPITLAVDPATLTPGAHKLFIRAHDAGFFPDGILSGVYVLTFEVAPR